MKKVSISTATQYYNYGSKSDNRLLITLKKESKKVKLDLNEGSLVVSPYVVISGNNCNTLKHSLWHNTTFNIENHDSLTEQLNDYINTKEVVLYGALECIRDPRVLLASLRKLCIDNGAVIRVYYSEFLQESECYRKYTRKELENFLTCGGFDVIAGDNYILLRCDQQKYDLFLQKNRLPLSAIIHVALTTEHPDYRVTGGIGSYIKESQSHYGNASTVMIIDKNDHYLHLPVDTHRWLSPQKLLSNKAVDYMMRNDHGFFGDALLASIQQMLYYYPDIKIVELSDYGSLAGERIIQAKQSGILPRDLQLVTVCHGSTLYTANGARKYIQPAAIPTMLREAYSIRNADKTIFLTDYVKNLYASYGLVAKKDIKERLPLKYSDIPNFSNEYLDICKRLIYIGKPTLTKGFDLFLESSIKIIQSQIEKYNTSQIEEIVCFTTFTEVPDPYIEGLMGRLSSMVELKLMSVPRIELFELLHSYAADSLAVVTYRADNHPNVILELMAIGVDFLAVDGGGIPELLNPKTKHHYLVQPDAKSIATKANAAMRNRKKRSKINKLNTRWYLKQQETINNSYSLKKLQILAKNENDAGHTRHIDRNDVSVIVPVYNTDLSQIVELCNSLNNQSIIPKEVLFINDGSTINNYASQLSKCINENYLYKARVINKSNGGLASARNVGLNAATTKYVATIDSDDIVSNYYIEDLLRAKVINDKAIAVTPYLSDFTDGRAYDIFNPNAYEYHPTGSSLATPFFPSNFFGSASAIFDRAKLIQLTGGWDESDKSMWEDWALYIRLKSLGESIQVLPKILYFYRVRKNSMVRTHSKQKASDRLIRNYTSIPHFDAYLLYSQMKYLDDIHNGRYPLEIWNPITSHGRAEAIKEFEKKYHIDKIKKVYRRGRLSGAVIKGRFSRNGQK
jgi:glycosyltransferase involved in cell wall biosynthesis